MNTPNAETSVRARHAAPFVGMRPFVEGEQDLFYGRDRDAARLRDKVFSARLTLFYGPSGVGKSSVLHTLLVPLLAEQRAHAVFYDAWRVPDPSAALKARLIEVATGLGIPAPGAGSPSLVDLVRMLAITEERTLVLVLDQFEEFFNAHGDEVDPLRKELAQLAHASHVDIRLVLSLREEHLAALEPFRVELPDLFQSTFRLEPLGAPSVRDAILKPLAHFEGSCEPALLSELVTDLQQEHAHAPGRPPPGEAQADLPILQLVCSQLWQTAQQRGTTSFTAALYHDGGGRQGIEAAYLQRIMPHKRSAQLFTARLMEHLAPGDGHKIGLSSEHLTELTRLPRPQVEAELTRLSAPDIRVLRTRQHGTGSVLYELWHDSFIRIIKPWADERLRRARRSRRTMVAFGLVGLLAAGLSAGVVGGIAVQRAAYAKKAHEAEIERASLSSAERVTAQSLRDNVFNVWNNDALKGASAKLDHVSNYLLFTSQDPNRLDILKRELLAHEANIPAGYGIEQSGQELVTVPTREEEWPFTVYYSPRSGLDPFKFNRCWIDIAVGFNQNWGIPTPLLLAMEQDETLPDDQMRFTGDRIEPLPLVMHGWRRQDMLLSSASLAGPGFEFLRRFEADWQALEVLGDHWWIVPRWSLPAWKASDVLVYEGDCFPALVLGRELQANPERLITSETVEMVIDGVAKQYPVTATEALAVRGARLVGDLQELVRKSQSLTLAPSMLDSLADRGDGEIGEIIDDVVASLASMDVPAPPRLHGPHASVPARDSGRTPPAYRESVRYLPDAPAPLRVYVGSRLIDTWAPGGQLSPTLHQHTEEARDRAFRRTGIVLPGAQFHDEERRGLGPDDFRVEIWNQTRESPDVVRVTTSPEDPAEAIDRLSSALVFQVETYRTYLLNSDMIDRQLAAMGPELRGWLESRYSRTDLKRLLREVVRPSESELKLREAAFEASAFNTEIDIPPERSIAHPTWLLGSLVFWSAAGDPRALFDMAAGLRRTQAARLDPAEPELPVGHTARAARITTDGVTALVAGRVREAERAFSKAARLDREAAIAAFLAAYPRQVAAKHAAIEATCRESRGYLSNEERLTLTDIVDAPDFERSADAAAVRSLRLCLLAAQLAVPGASRLPPLVRVLRERHPDFARWPTQDALWFGRKLLTAFDPAEDDRSLVEDGKALVKRGLDDPKITGWVDILQECGTPGPHRWCRELLPELARSTPRKLDVAWFFANSQMPEDATRALEIVAETERGLKPAERGERAQSIDIIRLFALITRAWTGDPEAAPKIDQILARHRDAGVWSLFDDQAEIDLTYIRGQTEEAARLADAAWANRPREANLLAAKLNHLLLTHDTDGLARLAKASDATYRKSLTRLVPDSGFLFVAATARLMGRAEGWEQTARDFVLHSDHPNIPYVALLLASRLEGKGRGEAQEVIRREWSRARPKTTWPARLREGDERVWREMLVGFAAGKVTRDELLADLEDDTRFAASDLRHLPLRRQGMLCEAYFYAALVAEMHGDREGWRANLEKTVATGDRQFFEYAMARFLLAEPVEPPTP